MKYSRETIAEVLAANDIVDIVGAFVELKGAGAARFKARCPFHNEKTPSFVVTRDRQMYHCFGCDKHGNALDFLCEYEGLTFIESLRKLAERAGIRLPAPTEAGNKEDFIRTKLIEFGRFACNYFKEALANPMRGSGCRKYLDSRQLNPETVRKFEIGYSPDDWSLLEKAREAGYRDDVLEASGLIRKSERGTLYPFFRDRLMVPIRDVSGNIVAFGGRALGDATPKYVNSPENVLYKKSRVLYGLYEAREALKREKYAILVEGYFDLMRCFDAGVENVVAPCGTALTPEHAALIRRYVTEVVVALDADAAGIRAALRSIGLLTNAGLSVRALTLPDGKDPDDYVRAHGAQAFRALIEQSRDFITFYVQMNADRTRTIEGRTEVAREIFQILAGLNDEIRRDSYLERAARELQIDKYACREEFRKFLNEQSGRATWRPQPAPERTRPALSQDDVNFVAALLSAETHVRKVQSSLENVTLPEGALTEVLRVLFESPGVHAGLKLESDAARALYAEAATVPAPVGEKIDEIIEKRVIAMKRDALLAEAATLLRDLQDAVRDGDELRALELLQRKAAIRRRLEEVGAT